MADKNISWLQVPVHYSFFMHVHQSTKLTPLPTLLNPTRVLWLFFSCHPCLHTQPLVSVHYRGWKSQYTEWCSDWFRAFIWSTYFRHFYCCFWWVISKKLNLKTPTFISSRQKILLARFQPYKQLKLTLTNKFWYLYPWTFWPVNSNPYFIDKL